MQTDSTSPAVATLESLRGSQPTPDWVSEASPFEHLVAALGENARSRAVLVPPHGQHEQVVCVSTDALSRKLAQPHFADLHAHRTVADALVDWPVRTLVLQANDRIGDVVDAIKGRKASWRYEPVVVQGTNEDDDFFIVEVHDLLVAQLNLLRRAQHTLNDAHRAAGRAEIACSVLHDVGNALNSVNVSSQVAGERLGGSRNLAKELMRAVALLRDAEASNGLEALFAPNGRGRSLAAYLKTIADSISDTYNAVGTEVAELCQGLEHIQSIVAAQQSSAKAEQISAAVEPVNPVALVGHALRLSGDDPSITLNLDLPDDLPWVTTDGHRVVRILTNFITNARWAVDEGQATQPEITVGVRLRDDEHGQRLQFYVRDNGIGFESQRGKSLFAPGYTTRPGGHGVGLHSVALAAEEVGGSVKAHSDGPGLGAIFELVVPLPVVQQDHLKFAA